MAVRTTVVNLEGIYFITFTCQQWLPLFEITNSYDSVYKWFDYLKTKGHYIKGFVIMPNHLHALIDFSVPEKSINTIISNGKRFMAYEIVNRLQEQNNAEILLKLADAVTDCKLITSQHFFLQKLSYMHYNPCSGVWNLVHNPVDYIHSSARYYINGEQ